jgi:hypothetical protein
VAVDYRIAVALAMSSNHNAVLGALSAHLLGVHAKVNSLTGGFNRLKLAIGGALSATAGVAILETMTKLVEKTKGYSDELVKLERLGGDMGRDVRSGAMSQRAFELSRTIPMKVEDLLKIPGASYSILGQEDSLKVWEKLAQFQFVMASQKDFKGDAGEDMQKFLRAGELGGRLTDPNTHKAAIEELERFLDLSSKVMAATHGMVNPSTLLGMSQQAGFSMRGMTDEGFMNMAIAAQAMGGPRAGTALLSLFNQVATGKLTKPAAMGMEDIGLLKEGEWYSDHGRVIINDSAKARLGKILGKNPMDFVDNILENLEKQGITDPEEQRRRVSNAMSRQTSQRFVIEQMMNREQIGAERGRMQGGLGSGSSFDLIKDKSVGANLEALTAAWNNFQVALVGPNSEKVIEILKSLTSILNSMQASVLGMDPSTLTTIAAGIATLGVALTGGGMVALVAAIGPAGWIAAGLIAISVAAAKWGPDLLKGVYAGLDGMAAAINRFVAWLGTIVAKIQGMLGLSPADKGAIDNSHNGEGGIWKNRFDPGTSKSKPPTISLALNVDGRALARVVSQAQEALYRYETNPTDFNGAGRSTA